MERIPLLIVGAGPYALSTAALARRNGIDTVVVGEPMEFWRRHMPEGLLLRSGTDWHLDPDSQFALESFLQQRGIASKDVDPIPVGLFIDYAEWFRAAAGIEVRRGRVLDVIRSDGLLEATLEDGRRVSAEAVVVAPGVSYFTNLPEWVQACLPSDRFSHTCHLTRFTGLHGQRVMTVGGRQSAFEWAALMGEESARDLHLVYRHDTPRFERSDWTFVEPYIEATLRVPGWFRKLTQRQRDAINQRFWAEGRLKLEPWLAPRIDRPFVCLHPEAVVTGCRMLPSEEIEVSLSNGERILVDHVLLATGYKPDPANVPFLSSLADDIETEEGFPVLDDYFQTTVSGLYFCGFAACRYFGPFFGFVRGCEPAAHLIVRALLRELTAATADSVPALPSDG